jgi:tRNA A37 N6-isopentenylltransferase MiaA
VKPPRREIEHYMGSIVIAPDRGDCRQRIDNRTGKMWDKGYVNCYEAITAQERDQRVGMTLGLDKCHRQGLQSRGR